MAATSGHADDRAMRREASGSIEAAKKPSPSGLDQSTLNIFEDARKRYALIEKAHAETSRDAKIAAPKLIGKQVLMPSGKRFQITDIENGWNGTIRARGYCILANGKRGTQKWEIGGICPAYFEAALAPATPSTAHGALPSDEKVEQP